MKDLTLGSWKLAGVSLLTVASSVLTAQGSLLWELPEAIELNGTKSGPSMDGNLIPEKPGCLSVSAWIRPRAFNTNVEIFRLEDSKRILFAIQTQGTFLTYGLAQSGYTELRAPIVPTEVTDENWHFACGAANGSVRQVWLDGILRAETTCGEINVGRNQLGYVGSFAGKSEIFNGGISGVQVRDEMLSPMDVSKAFVAGLKAFDTPEYVWSGAVGADWNAAGNWTIGGAVAPSRPIAASRLQVPAPATVTIPVNTTNAIIVVTGSGTFGVSGSTLTVHSLELANGTTFNIPAGIEVHAFACSVGGTAVPCGIYSGSSENGTALAGLSGAGVLRIANPQNGIFPTVSPQIGADGWYTFGLTDSPTMGEDQKYSAGKNYQFIKGEFVEFSKMAFPPDAKVRLVGGVLADMIPTALIGQLDVSGLNFFAVHTPVAPFPNGTPFTLPSGCEMRYFPGASVYSETEKKYYWTTVKQIPYDQPLVVNGTLRNVGNGNNFNPGVYTGKISGGGTIHLTNFNNFMRLTGELDYRGGFSGLQEGCSVWIQSPKISAKMGTISLGSCSYRSSGKRTTNYTGCGILFGRDDADPRIDGTLEITKVTGNASISYNDSGTDPWRQGGHLMTWGGNTVHIGTVENGLHLVGYRTDYQASNGNFKLVNARGVGNFEIDELKDGLLTLSTNVNVVVGKVTSASSVIDYSLQSGGFNPRTLDFTKDVPAAVVLKATDIAMLPARLSGFAGSIQLTDATLGKTYDMAVDLSVGPDGLYNPVGCNGSGTLAAVPETGTINVSFAGETVKKGAYALARFTAGGEKLANWTVNLSTEMYKGYAIKVVKDTTGIWLKVCNPGLTLIFR